MESVTKLTHEDFVPPYQNKIKNNPELAKAQEDFRQAKKAVKDVLRRRDSFTPEEKAKLKQNKKSIILPAERDILSKIKGEYKNILKETEKVKALFEANWNGPTKRVISLDEDIHNRRTLDKIIETAETLGIVDVGGMKKSGLYEDLTKDKRDNLQIAGREKLLPNPRLVLNHIFGQAERGKKILKNMEGYTPRQRPRYGDSIGYSPYKAERTRQLLFP